MKEVPVYEVVSPLGKKCSDTITPAAPLPTLEGKTIGAMWTLYTNGDVVANSLMDLLSKKYKDIKFVKLPPGRGLQWGNYPDNESIGDVVKESGVDGLIVTMGC